MYEYAPHDQTSSLQRVTRQSSRVGVGWFPIIDFIILRRISMTSSLTCSSDMSAKPSQNGGPTWATMVFGLP